MHRSNYSNNKRGLLVCWWRRMHVTRKGTFLCIIICLMVYQSLPFFLMMPYACCSGSKEVKNWFTEYSVAPDSKELDDKQLQQQYTNYQLRHNSSSSSSSIALVSGGVLSAGHDNVVAVTDMKEDKVDADDQHNIPTSIAVPSTTSNATTSFSDELISNKTMADDIISSSSQSKKNNATSNNTVLDNKKKLILPGNHVNIPPPESRIGPNGERGYVHDPKFLLKKNQTFLIGDDEAEELCRGPGNGTEGANGYFDVMKIRNHIETSKSIRQQQSSKNIKLFCAIYTYSGGVGMTNAVSETWGPKCDGILFASNESNNVTGHMHLPSNSPRGFSYKGMVQRVRTILAYLYDHFLEEYDYFHICGDDVYMIVENMKEFLASEKVQEWEKDPNQYFFAGFWMHWGKWMKDGYFYLGGGSGYTISRRALKAFVEGPLQYCDVYRGGAAEDVYFSDCARNLTSNFIYTGDESGAQRYHQGPVWKPIMYNIVSQSLLHMHRPPISIPQKFDYHGLISNSTITFHKHYRPLELRRLHLLLYKDLDLECSSFRDNNLENETNALEISTSETDMASVHICPTYNYSTDKQFPPGFPQNLTFGRFTNEKGAPFITQDFWADIVDNKRTFFLRHTDPGFPSITQLIDWIRSRPYPITLVLNNQHDKSWPDDLSDITDYQILLNETNLHAVYAGNARYIDGYPKLKPLPIGLKWQFRRTTLFGEPKNDRAAAYARNSASTSEEIEALFNSTNRTATVYFRSMLNSNRATRNYIKDTPALQMTRYSVASAVNTTARKSIVFNLNKVDQAQYFADLKKHRFMVSPPGKGLDTHSTWEALQAGCIPILPRSPLDPLFTDLPVWLVDSWDEVTDEAVERKDKEFQGKKYNWEKLFTPYWRKQIYEGLCKMPSEVEN